MKTQGKSRPVLREEIGWDYWKRCVNLDYRQTRGGADFMQIPKKGRDRLCTLRGLQNEEDITELKEY